MKKHNVYFGIFILLIILYSAIELKAQRIFGLNESNTVYEIPEVQTKTVTMYTVITPNQQEETIISNPFKLYVYSEFPIEQDEIIIRQLMTMTGEDIDNMVFTKNDNKNYTVRNTNINKLSPFLYEISIEGDFDLKGETHFSVGNALIKVKFSFLPSFVVCYYPNKDSKKKRRSEKFWYASLTTHENQSQINNYISWNEIINSIQTDYNLDLGYTAYNENSQNFNVPNNGQNQQRYNKEQGQPQKEQHNFNSQNQVKDQLFLSDVDKNIPENRIKNENSFAVIIANENYSSVSNVPYAEKDGEILEKYLTLTLGLPKDHVKVYKNASFGNIAAALKHIENLSEAFGKDLNLIFYYAGHGMPNEKTKNPMLIPVDGDAAIPETCYELDKVISTLGNLNANSIVVMLDACFSGTERGDGMLMAARGIRIKSNQSEPTGNMVILSASQGDETAYPFDSEQHGLFTYFLLKKIQEKNGDVTLGELADYITEQVKRQSVVSNGKLQTPTVSVSPTLQSSWRNQKFGR